MDGGLGVGLVVGAAVVAALAVRHWGLRIRTRRLWWLAAVGAAVGAGVALAASPVPLAAGVAAAGLAAAAVVDGVEGRVPTALAHGTTGVSFVLLLIDGDWDDIVPALLTTALFVAVLAVLWLAGQAGFGDVRLAGGTMTGLVGGLPALGMLVVVAFLVAGIVTALRRQRGTASGRVPFAPSIAVGWVFSVLTA